MNNNYMKTFESMYSFFFFNGPFWEKNLKGRVKFKLGSNVLSCCLDNNGLFA